MKTENAAQRIYRSAASIEGVMAFLQEMVEKSGDANATKQAFAFADLLERVSDDLDEIAGEIEASERSN